MFSKGRAVLPALVACWGLASTGCGASAEADPGADVGVLAEPLLANYVERRLRSGEPTNAGHFGSSVAVDDGLAVIGAHAEPDGGAAYVFERIDGGWVRVAQLLPPVGTLGFGWSVAVDKPSSRIVVGAPFSADRTGRAFVFAKVNGTWQLEAEVAPSARFERDFFGFSVAVAPQLVVVSSPFRIEGSGSSTGAVHVFNSPSAGRWAVVERILGSTWTGGGDFGYAVAAARLNDTLFFVVGAPNATARRTNLTGAGMAVVFRRSAASPQSTWTASLVSPEAIGGGWFGASVDIGVRQPHLTAIVGEPHATANGFVKGGAAHVFTSWQWRREGGPLISNRTANESRYGQVTIDGDVAAVAAMSSLRPTVFGRAGSAWSVHDSVLIPKPNIKFGYALGISGNDLIVTAPSDDGNAPNAGAAFAHRVGLADGDACTSATQCLNGLCVDGICGPAQ